MPDRSKLQTFEVIALGDIALRVLHPTRFSWDASFPGIAENAAYVKELFPRSKY